MQYAGAGVEGVLAGDPTSGDLQARAAVARVDEQLRPATPTSLSVRNEPERLAAGPGRFRVPEQSGDQIRVAGVGGVEEQRFAIASGSSRTGRG